MTESQRHISIPLRQFVEREINHLDEKYRIIQDKNTEAIKKAEYSMEHRLEGMNEFRAQLKDQTGTFITKNELDIYKDKVSEEIKMLSKYINIGIGVWLILQILIGVVLAFLVRGT